MLKEFLERLGKVTGKTYTPAEFKQIVEEALKVDAAKQDEKPVEKKNK
jgi:hypothetical protein